MSEHREADGLRVLQEAASALLRAAPGPVTSLSLRNGGWAMEITWARPGDASSTHADAPVQAPTGTAGAAESPADGDRLWEVTAPLVGTFYVAPEPGAEPFVSPPARVRAGETVGIVEAMKLMNPVPCPWSGEVVDLLVGDGESVEFGQPLARIRADDPAESPS